MRIFISHSSQDQWIARRISQDLEGVGAETFLDEKDLETGDSIDEAIQAHLKECEELVMILSPAALSSHWVLLEIGSAKALGLRLVPILLHVGPNDLPPPLGKGLARNINDIDKYYSEVRKRLAGTPVPDRPVRRLRISPRRPIGAESAEESAASASRALRTFKVGDLVRIPAQTQNDFVTQNGELVSWVDDMTPHLGKTATVTVVDDDRTVGLDVAEQRWWAMDWLEPAPSSASPPTI